MDLRVPASVDPCLDEDSESDGVGSVSESESIYSYNSEDDATYNYRPSAPPQNHHTSDDLGRNGQQHERPNAQQRDPRGRSTLVVPPTLPIQWNNLIADDTKVY